MGARLLRGRARWCCMSRGYLVRGCWFVVAGCETKLVACSVRSPRRRGSIALETALYLPILFLLLFGTVELAKITYTYYTLQKIMASVARYAGTQQGVNFCDAGD